MKTAVPHKFPSIIKLQETKIVTNIFQCKTSVIYRQKSILENMANALEAKITKPSILPSDRQQINSSCVSVVTK